MYVQLPYYNPDGYAPANYSETLNKPSTIGVIYINELYVNTLHYGTLASAQSVITPNGTQTPLATDPNNPIFQNLYFNTLTNSKPLIDMGYNDITRAANAGNIIYGGSKGMLSIYGCGSTVGTRNMTLYDNVIVSNNITVNNTVNTLNVFTSNLNSAHSIGTSLLTCDILKNSTTATMGTVYINDNLGISIYPLNVGKNVNNNSINCTGNINAGNIFNKFILYRFN